MTRIRRFIQESVAELRKVSWPTFLQTRNLTVLVFTVSFLVGLFVWFWDIVFKFGIGLVPTVGA
ncbi:MAG TPA: preprotein translocase subunit SecE [Candidatus Limnocylindrales bacterium]|nr:preprotein translocase subunit SecE [Candidatus Limnocylindrales bacterium]